MIYHLKLDDSYTLPEKSPIIFYELSLREMQEMQDLPRWEEERK